MAEVVAVAVASEEAQCALGIERLEFLEKQGGFESGAWRAAALMGV